MLFGEVGDPRSAGAWFKPSLMGWSALLAVATILTPFAVWAVVRVATLLGA